MIEYRTSSPSPDEWCIMRKETNWKIHSSQVFEHAIRGSLHFALAYENNKIIAMGRVVGDNKLCFYIQDVVVKEEYRLKGVGTTIVQMLLRYIFSVAAPNATIALKASKNKEGFYEKLGFIKCNEISGLGMVMSLNPNWQPM